MQDIRVNLGYRRSAMEDSGTFTLDLGAAAGGFRTELDAASAVKLFDYLLTTAQSVLDSDTQRRSD